MYGPCKGSSSRRWQIVYFFQDRRSGLLMPREIATKISLWITMQGPCVCVCVCVCVCGLVYRPPSLARNSKMYACVLLCFYVPPLTSIILLLFLGDVYLDPPPHHHHHISLKWPDPSLHMHAAFSWFYFIFLSSVTVSTGLHCLPAHAALYLRCSSATHN